VIPFDWTRIEAAYRALLARSIESVADLELLLLDRDALDAQVLEEEAQIYDRTKVNTADGAAKRKYRSFCEDVQPGADELQSQLDRKIVESPWAADLGPRTHAVLLRNLRAAVESFRPENVGLTTRELVLEASHGECIGSMSIELDGETLTLPAAEARLESPDADTRRRTWVAVASRRLEDAEHIDQVFDGLVKLRDRMGRNVGFAGYTELAFQNKRRFDYTPADCEAFHAGVEEHFVPLQTAVWEQRCAQHGLQSLGPWDLRMSCDVGEPLSPFVTTDELVDKTSQVFHRLDPELGALFDRLRDSESLDLESRPGKAPGGYQNSYAQSKRNFIFMNAVGLQGDVTTLLHEGGHAFHSMLASDQPLLAYREACAEFSEVASMTMELLAHPYLDTFYTEPDAQRARRLHLERIVLLFPWIAEGDAFQHWVYEHPESTADERAGLWCELDSRFRPGIDWSGYEPQQARDWHRIPHFFTHPHYYVEYGIAQLGALGIWQRALVDEADALAHYKAALRLGGSRPLPELFAAAGIEFDLGPDALERAADVLRDALQL